MSELPKVYTLDEVAAHIGMSRRWVADRVNKDGAEHIRFRKQVRFTAEQVEALVAMFTVKAPEQSMTTGRKRRG